METKINEPEYIQKIGKLSPKKMEAWSKFSLMTEKSGVLTPRQKELISLSLAINAKCDWLISLHVKNCLKSGATRKEIIETTWLAIQMGGSPSLMYSQLVLEALEEFGQVEEDEVILRARTQLAIDAEYKKLYWQLVEYVKSICNEVEINLEDNKDRLRLAMNIADSDGAILGILVQKECVKRNWS